ncbi:DNA mismatch repair protein [Eggerthellaceae bacterium zg-1084]|uniref:Sau3AI family type II restriction endonuclease n=1 Tax=Berryella wangjianweii TaxID=2734634 RepID=UPI00155775BE|nr:Sau3AI family type II restriction endonuclease [Berryella wangjianweii]NPD30390.1 DNA mismatch repair protein [Berryella wangjianweii]
MLTDSLPYDPSDADSIMEYASLLMGSTLREHVDVSEIADPKQRKGSFGNAVEHYYFHYNLNSDSNPDFAEVGMELKCTPLKLNKKGEFLAKERLVITMANYMDVVNETWETSTLLHKASDILLISYLYEKEKDPLDYEIVVAARWGLPEEDMPVFKQDWETIVGKVRAGKAHEISGSDTLYLEACTKASDSSKRRQQPFSDIPAKPRAWALKASYMTAVQNSLINSFSPIVRNAGEEELPLIELVRNRFSTYFGTPERELGQKFGYLHEGQRAAKNLCALITKRILDVDENSKIEEFEKANIKPKTIRLKRNGRPKEAVSFPVFDYCALAETPFEESDFLEYLQMRYLFVIYREDEKENDLYLLSDVVFWQMGDEDLDEARKCYEEMQRRVIDGHAENSVKSTENRCCHVRPHGRNAADACMTPYGIPVTKKCFWLNQDYLAKEIKKACG